MIVSLPCDVCGKHYTREDNLRRHIQLKHPGGSLSLPQRIAGIHESELTFADPTLGDSLAFGTLTLEDSPAFEIPLEEFPGSKENSQ
jgi:hypothetical protein